MVLILDDHPIARQGLASLIELHFSQKEIAQAGTVREAKEQVQKENAEVAFIDLNLGVESGFDFLEWALPKYPQMKTFLITSCSRKSDFEYAKRLGVDAYVLKDAFVDEILYGLTVVQRGGKFYSPALFDTQEQLSQDERCVQQLTNRELDVLMLLGQGLCNEKISKQLYISEGTTKKYVAGIMEKLNATNRVEAALFANKNTFLLQRAYQSALLENRRKERVV
ncbi:response regulator transcription factor [Pygmaiobacter massiliensis]|uniref:response regulator transcription factor n=1 Tax=Pygmaiobacter massiliensis TaxID=1917873 RepID=UPI000C7DB7DB|nr:response regulator transcription factor [Pygmaiobacter massiliensis]